MEPRNFSPDQQHLDEELELGCSVMAVPSPAIWMDAHNSNVVQDLQVEKYLPLHKAILQGKWEVARMILKEDPEAIRARITAFSETPLLVAVKRGKGMHIVKRLVELMPPEALALTDFFGNTALHAVAVLGNVQAAKLFVQKNQELPNIWNNDGSLPLHLAAMRGQREMTLYLFSVTREDEDLNPYEDEAGATLMRFAIDAGFYDLAAYLLVRNPKLAWEDISPLELLAQEPSAFPSGTSLNIWQHLVYKCVPVKLTRIMEKVQGGTAIAADCCQIQSKQSSFQKLHFMFWSVLEIFVPPIKHIHLRKLMHLQALQLVRNLCTEIIALNIATASSLLKSPFLLGAQNGIHEIVKEILESFPQAITFVDEENHTAFHLSVMYRHEKVFNIMHQQSGQHKLFLSLVLDNQRNNVLHLVGYKAHQYRLEFSTSAVLKMQRELQWYKEVEKFVLPQERKSKNNDGKTPLMIFNEEHAELMTLEGQWMIGMATSCSVAASLIATIAFAAAITVPGGNNSDGFPIFSQESAFKVFAVSDAIALLSSIITMLAFLSIFTTRYAVIDFLYALPNRLIIGLIALLLSVLSMMIAFSSTVYVVFALRNPSVIVPAIALACLPVVLFAHLQLPPLLNMIRSTYGPSIFGN